MKGLEDPEDYGLATRFETSQDVYRQQAMSAVPKKNGEEGGSRSKK